MLLRPVIFRLVRSGAAGILATATDTGTLAVLVSLLHVSYGIASVVALTLGSIVMFIGQKYFVFRAHLVSTLGREALFYAIVQAVGIALSTWLFEVFLRLDPRLEHYYLLVRLVVNNLVWLFYFFPLWHFVFKAPAKPVV